MGTGASTYDKESFGFKDEIADAVTASFPGLDGKVVAVTGCSTGLGLEVAKTAALKNARMILMLNRRSQRSTAAEDAVREVVNSSGSPSEVRTVECDLQSLSSTRSAAASVSDIVQPLGGLDVLANNAGIMAMPDRRTADGYEVQMQTNQLSHVLLTKLLFPQLEAAAASRGEARVAFHSSGARQGPSSNLRPEFFRKSEAGSLGGDHQRWYLEMMFGSGGPWQRYHQTKLANASFAMALHDKLQERGSKVKAVSADPGLATTELQARSVDSGLMPASFANFLFKNVKGQTPRDGAMDFAQACFGGDTESGDFFMPENGSTGAPKKTISGGVPVVRGQESLVVSQVWINVSFESLRVFCPSTSLGL
uniref:Protochlorophyllide reductase n=2 Tax=Phaeomonas parva TaxID=124430 RepID=A0A7S1TXN1_9STRA|mmetsp:Transcript_22745/g.70427  ORF Transcript_22745/g.70427 Transcript_22745/m.70427 type:complete len:366 (+) Transcript_22745:175-1272(+)